MIELALLLGLGAVGYMLAKDQPKTLELVEQFSNGHALPRNTETIQDDVVHSQESKGHSNEVPFFGARVTQSMYSGATDHILDKHTGAGKEYFQKRETQSFYDVKAGTGNPFGQQVESDFRVVVFLSSNKKLSFVISCISSKLFSFKVSFSKINEQWVRQNIEHVTYYAYFSLPKEPLSKFATYMEHQEGLEMGIFRY
jgi:hypothetical protein